MSKPRYIHLRGIPEEQARIVETGSLWQRNRPVLLYVLLPFLVLLGLHLSEGVGGLGFLPPLALGFWVIYGVRRTHGTAKRLAAEGRRLDGEISEVKVQRATYIIHYRFQAPDGPTRTGRAFAHVTGWGEYGNRPTAGDPVRVAYESPDAYGLL